VDRVESPTSPTSELGKRTRYQAAVSAAVGCTVGAARTLRSRSLSGWQGENADERLRDCKASSHGVRPSTSCCALAARHLRDGRQRPELLSAASRRTKILTHTSMQGPLNLGKSHNVVSVLRSRRPGCGDRAVLLQSTLMAAIKPCSALVAAAAQVWTADAPVGGPTAVNRPSGTC